MYVGPRHLPGCLLRSAVHIGAAVQWMSVRQWRRVHEVDLKFMRWTQLHLYRYIACISMPVWSLGTLGRPVQSRFLNGPTIYVTDILYSGNNFFFSLSPSLASPVLLPSQTKRFYLRLYFSIPFSLLIPKREVMLA